MTSDNWICDFCQTKNDFHMANCATCFNEKLSIEIIITRIIFEAKNYHKTLSPDLEPSFRVKADLLLKLIIHPTFGPYLKDKFLNDEIKIDFLNQTLSEYVVLEDVINFLKRTCSICLNDFPFPNMCQMISCKCEFCKNCLEEWLKDMIMTKPTKDWFCPSCPKNEMNKVNKNLHFQSLQVIIESDETLKNLFHDKLRDEKLETSTMFRWCKNEQCINGFEIIDEVQVKVECPVCKLYMCTRCNIKWHENETCDEYQIRKLKEDPDLSKLLMTIGIECPKCQMQFDLAKGGCLHFKCSKCYLDFCGCCKEIFRKGKCEIPKCNQTALHAHHPNNCGYYTRDYQIDKLESIFKKKFEIPNKLIIKMCPTIVTDINFKDSKCRKKCHKDVGLCKEHYTEYLCLMIYKSNIDVTLKSNK